MSTKSRRSNNEEINHKSVDKTLTIKKVKNSVSGDVVNLSPRGKTVLTEVKNTDSSSDEDSPPKSRRSVSPRKTLKSDSSSDEDSPPKSRRSVSPRKTLKSDSSSDEDSPPKSRRSVSPRKTLKSDSSSDEDSPPKSRRSVSPRKTLKSDSSSDEDSPPKSRRSVSPRKTFKFDSSSDEDSSDDEIIAKRKKSYETDSSSDGEINKPKKTLNIPQRSSISQKAFSSKSATPKSLSPSGISTEDERKSTSKNLTAMMISNGYVPLDNVVLDNKVIYTKVYTKHGDIAFISPDQTGKISATPSKKTVVEEVSGKVIPQSVKIKTSECAGNSVCGVAFQCKGEYCFLNRTDEGKIKEATFEISNNSEIIKKDASPIAYPIITLSEIETDNDKTLERVRTATQKLDETCSSEIMNHFDETIKKLMKLTEEVKSVKEKFVLMENARKIEQNFAGDKIKELDPENTIDQASIKIVSDKRLSSTEFSLSVKSLAHKYLSLTNSDLDTLQTRTNDDLMTNFTLVMEKLDTKMEKSASLRKAENWGLPKSLNDLSSNQIISGNFTVPEETKSNESEVKSLKSLKRVVS